MKSFKLKHASIALILLIILGISSFGYTINQKTESADNTNYYWYDAYGNYLWRQNTITDECYVTGFDQLTYSPNTLQEKGYAPANVSGYPPTPNNPSAPSVRLYSHP